MSRCIRTQRSISKITEKMWNKQSRDPMVDSLTQPPFASSAKLFVIWSPRQCTTARLWGAISINSTVYLLSFHPTIYHGYRKAYQIPPVKTSDQSWWTIHDAYRRGLITSKLHTAQKVYYNGLVNKWISKLHLESKPPLSDKLAFLA
jgi:hypothetical protein